MNSGAQPNGGIVAAVNNAAAGAVNAVANAANGAVNVVANATSGAVNAVANAATNAATNLSKAANAVVSNVPFVNSMIPIGNARSNNGKKNNGGILGNFMTPPPANNGANKGNGGILENLVTSPDQGPNVGTLAAVNNAVNTAANAVNTAVNGIANTAGNFGVIPNNGSAGGSGLLSALGIFVGLMSVFLLVFAVFNKQIKQGYEYFAQTVKQALGLSTATDVAAQITPSEGVSREITMPPQAPQDLLPSQASLQHQNIVEKILPSAGANEVFNVSQNKFTFYDAEPLCRALGAELATYEQVKDAWGKGADWCNYGWVKGQMAVYPTQKETYEKLQMGPPDEQGACGTVGVNGGSFENPEMRFGVNCYGKKPGQSAHDESQLMSEGKIPKSVETLKVDKMMAEFKKEVDSLFVKPFNDHKWSTAF